MEKGWEGRHGRETKKSTVCKNVTAGEQCLEPDLVGCCSKSYCWAFCLVFCSLFYDLSPGKITTYRVQWVSCTCCNELPSIPEPKLLNVSSVFVRSISLLASNPLYALPKNCSSLTSLRRTFSLLYPSLFPQVYELNNWLFELALFKKLTDLRQL